MTEVPEKCNMNVVLDKGLTPNEQYKHYNGAALDHIVPRCGTVGCIAGWTSEIYGFDPTDFSGYPRWSREAGARMQFAAAVLGLNREEAARLFTEPRLAGRAGNPSAWPLDLAKEYEAATTVREKAAVIRRRADRFIVTGGAE